MVQIVVTNEQAKQIASSDDAIEILDQSGNRIGFFAKPFSDAEIAEARHRSKNETIGCTTDEVLDRLTNLESE
jgi:hypothetical protein